MQLRDNDQQQRARVNEQYKMITSRLTSEDWKEIRTEDYWTQRDKLKTDMQKQIFTINWIRIWNQTGQIGNNVRVPPRPDAPESAIAPNDNFDEDRL